jgi:hypothetical protein
MAAYVNERRIFVWAWRWVRAHTQVCPDVFAPGIQDLSETIPDLSEMIPDLSETAPALAETVPALAENTDGGCEREVGAACGLNG